MSKAYIKRDLAVGKDYADVDGGGGGGGGVNYSTEEQATGYTWIDDAVVYQKSFEITLPGAYDSGTNFIVEADASYIDKLIAADCCVKSAQGYMAGPGIRANGWSFAVYRGSDGKLLLYSGSGDAIFGGTAFITIKYTKSE